MKDQIIAQTIAGSRLYGLSHLGSDTDIAAVSLNKRRKSRQTINSGIDLTVHPLDLFVERVTRGLPQALEILYSSQAWFDPQWAPFLWSLSPDPYMTERSYLSAIRRYSFADCSLKEHRRAVRLWLNLKTFKKYSKFNPTLDDTERNLVYKLADDKEFMEQLNNLQEAL